jgi:plasmid stability protein
MPMTITLKNIPDDIYAQLRQSADRHHRSLNSEVIACLERVLLAGAIEPTERLARIQRLRPRRAIKMSSIDSAKHRGRP